MPAPPPQTPVSDSAGYAGSRKEKQRYEYSGTSRSGFAELSPAYVMTGQQLFDALQNVPGVARVHWHTSKRDQGNPSDNHYMQTNIMVYSKSGGSSSANSPMEFEVTRNKHSKAPDVPYTVTVMFKEPPAGLEAEAWRILRAVVKGKELLPDHVRNYMEKSLARLDGQHAPGSASASAPQSAGLSAAASSSQGRNWPLRSCGSA